MPQFLVTLEILRIQLTFLFFTNNPIKLWVKSALKEIHKDVNRIHEKRKAVSDINHLMFHISNCPGLIFLLLVP